MAKKSDITGKNAKAEEIALTEFVAQATNLLKKSKTQSEIQTMKNIDFGNGRYVRTIVERAAMAQAFGFCARRISRRQYTGKKKTKGCRWDSRGSKRIALAKLQNARRVMVQVQQTDAVSIEKI